MMNKFTLSIFLLCLFLAVPAFSQAAESSESRPAQAVLEDISRLLEDFRFDEAISLFDTIDPLEAASSRIRLLKASVLNSAGKLPEARLIAQEVSSLEPANLDALFVLSAIEAAAGRTKEQQALLEKILREDPANISALTELGTLHFQARAVKTAVGYFDQVLEADPENLTALLSRAQIYRLYRDPFNAEVLLNKAVSLYPGEAPAWYERARLYKGAGFPIPALADLDKAKELDMGDYWIAMDRGDILLDLNRKEQALEDFERAAALKPDDFLAYVYTAGIKDDLGDPDGAEKDYETLARLKPDYYFAFEGVGLHKMRRGQWAEARDAFLEVYRQAPNEYYYALLAAANWMRADNVSAPRQFLNQAMTKLNRDSIEYYMLRLYYDLTGRVYAGENDTIVRIDKETDREIKGRMLFYLALYYDVRGLSNLSNKYFSQFREMELPGLPEWRYNQWLMEERDLLPF